MRGLNTTRGVKPLVSVIIPTYNRARLLQEALDSVFAQEGVGELFDMEVIVADDASSDETPEVVRRYPAVRYIRLPQNGGASAARNAGIKASSGKYVAFLDDDDLWLPHRLRVQVPVLEANPEIGVVYGQMSVTDGESFTDAWPDMAPSGHVFEAFLTLTDDFMSPGTLLVRREVFEKAGYFDESLPTMEHYDMYLRLAFHVPFLFLPGPVGVGRFSKQGKWARNVANGLNELVLPRIVERALSMLPDTAEYVAIRRQARTAVCSTIAGQRWWNGGVDLVRSHLLSTLEAYPWMATEPPIVQNLCRVGGDLAMRSDTPVSSVRAFWSEVRTLTGGRGITTRVKMQRLLADMLTEAAVALGNNGSPRAAGYVAAWSIVHDPTQPRRKVVSTLMSRAVLQSIRSWRPFSRRSSKTTS